MQKILCDIMAAFLTVLSFFCISYDNSQNTPIDPKNGGDPFIIEDSTGTYYTYTTGSGITINKIKSINDTEIIQSKTVFSAGMNGTTKDIWAPEIHKIGDKWYIISCAVFDKNAVPRGAMPEASVDEHDDFYRYAFVLESKTDDIFGEYEFKNILAPSGLNNIDGTYLKKDNKLYFVTSSYLDAAYQCITISEMADPFTLKTDSQGNTVTSIISKPQYKWEKHGWRVNEGPAVLYRENNIYIVYSASGFSSGHYCLGMLTLTGNDILSPCSWAKSVTRVMYHQPLKNIFNAGHCSFVYKDNGDVYMVYHATQTEDFNQSPRLTFIKKVKFAHNYPIFY